MGSRHPHLGATGGWGFVAFPLLFGEGLRLPVFPARPVLLLWRPPLTRGGWEAVPWRRKGLGVGSKRLKGLAFLGSLPTAELLQSPAN